MEMTLELSNLQMGICMFFEDGGSCWFLCQYTTKQYFLKRRMF